MSDKISQLNSYLKNYKENLKNQNPNGFLLVQNQGELIINFAENSLNSYLKIQKEKDLTKQDTQPIETPKKPLKKEKKLQKRVIYHVEERQYPTFILMASFIILYLIILYKIY